MFNIFFGGKEIFFEDSGTLPQNSYKPTQGIWEDTL